MDREYSTVKDRGFPCAKFMNPKAYYTVTQYAEKLHISARRVRTLCTDKRISGAMQVAGIWWIPRKTKDPRRPVGRPIKAFLLLCLIGTVGCVSIGRDAVYIERRIHNRGVLDSLINERIKVCEE